MTRRSLFWRVAVVLAAMLATGTVIVLKFGALAGSYEASLMARGSMLARSPELRSLDRFPSLNTGGHEFAQIWDREGNPVWKSPSLGPHELPPRIERRLSTIPLPDGSTGFFVCLWVRNDAGESLKVAVATPMRPYRLDQLRLMALLSLFSVLPVAVLAMLYPSPNKPSPGKNGAPPDAA